MFFQEKFVLLVFIIVSSSFIKCQEDFCDADKTNCNEVNPKILQNSCDQIEAPIVLPKIDLKEEVCYFS